MPPLGLLVGKGGPRPVGTRVAPAPPPPPPVAPTNLRTGNNPRGVAIAPPPKPTVNDRQVTAPQTFHDAGPTGNYGTPAANTYKQSPSYKQAVIKVFQAQPAKQQQSIVKGALTTKTPEAKMILDYVHQQTSGPAGELSPITAAIKAPTLGAVSNALTKAPTGVFKIAQNFAKDAWNLPGGTVQGMYGLGSDLWNGHYGNAFHMLVDPYVNLVEHPIKTFEQHPLNTALMLYGPKSLAGKGAGAVARSGALGEDVAKYANIQRAPLHLGTIAGEASPITEHRYYSNDLFNQAVQRSRENRLAKKGLNPNIARPAPRLMPASMQYTFNIGQEAKLARRADELTSIRQQAGRAERAAALDALRRAAPSKESRNVVSHVLQGVIKKPETAVADTNAEINRLKVAQQGLRSRSLDMLYNRMQVKDLTNALHTPINEESGIPQALHDAFGAAKTLRPTLQAQDAYLVAHGLLDPAQALRAKLFPYAQAHMGAKYNPATDSLEVPGSRLIPGVRPARQVLLPDVGQSGRSYLWNEPALAAGHTRLYRFTDGEGTTGHWADTPKTAYGYTLHTLDLPEKEAAKYRGGESGQSHFISDQAVADKARQVSWSKEATKQKFDLADWEKFNKAFSRDKLQGGTRYGRTRPIETQEILDHLKANGIPDPAYVGHFPGKVSPFRFYSAYKLARGTLGKGRTGLAFERGGYDHTWEGLAGQVASRAEATTKASLHDRVVNELSVVPGRDVFRRADVKYNRGLMTFSEADKLRRAAMVDDNGNAIPNATELVPIVASPMHTLGQVADLQHPHELQNLSELETTSLAHAVEDARNSTSRNVVLIPKVAAERFEQQFQRGDSMLRSIGKVTQQFRRTVLPYSTHWMMQIGSEAGLRALIGGALDPRYLNDGRRLMKELQTTPEGRTALMEMVNATFYNKRDPMAIYNPNAGVVASAAKAFPPTRMLMTAHNTYADAIGQSMYTLEHNARLMGLGKLAHKEVSSWGKAWQNGVRIQGRNLSQLAENLKADPTLVAHFGREIDNIFGKYNKFTPKERAMIQSLTPFLPWYLNAAKFVLWHLPKDHPVSSALLASLRQTINQDIQDGKGAPLNSYAMQELGRITPFGIFTPPSTTPTLGNFLKGQQATGAFLPQAEGSIYNLAGLNSFGEGPLTTAPDLNAPYGSDARKGHVAPMSTQAGIAALENLFEAFVPAARYARTAREGGGPAYGTSNVINPQPKPGNPGTAKGTVNRMFNPLYGFEQSQKSKSAPKYTSDKQQAAAKASSSSGWGFSSGGSSPASSGSGWGFSSGGSSSGGSSGWGFQ